MDANRKVAANTIEMSAGALAALTVERMTERSNGELPPFSTWKENLTGRLHELAAALRDDEPDLFADQMVWARQVCEARRVPLDQLHLSLQCLREVLQEELVGPASPWVDSFLDQAQTRIQIPASPDTSYLDGGTETGRRTAAYLEAVLSGDRRRAADLVVQAVRDGNLTVRQAYLEVLVPAQAEIGRLWLMNEAGIADEHFVTATTKLAMTQVLSVAKRAPANGKAVVTAAVTGNAHDVGVQALADFFELDGWRVVHLGADVPEEEVVRAAGDHSADLVALSVALPSHRAAAVRTIEALHAMDAPPRILVGGGSVGNRESWKRNGSDDSASTLEDGVARGRALVGLPPAPGSTTG